jgi:hypothetical protein
VTRDVNHPSILFWANGNEGGWNTELDGDYAQWDPQKRNVLHPWELFRGIDTKHYPDFALHAQKAAGNNVYFPTEMMHALYDGGGAAGLADYWNVILKSKVAAGGFIWVLADEDVKRVDQGGILDPRGNQAPDGIVGPYREKEGSFYAVKELWSPIVVTQGKDGRFTVENRYAFLDANTCTYTVEMRKFKGIGEAGAGHATLYSAAAKVPPIAPGASGTLEMPALPSIAATADAIAIVVKDKGGRELWTSVFANPARGAGFDRRTGLPVPGVAAPTATENADAWSVSANGLNLTFSKTTGVLTAAARGDKSFSLVNGPRFVALDAAPAPARGATAPAASPAPRLASLVKSVAGAGSVVLTATYEGALKSVTYRVDADGWLTVDYAYALAGPHEYFGVGFDCPETHVKGMRYHGSGPFRVWKNRLGGGVLDVWEKTLNNTVTGDPTSSTLEYPEFKGYYAGVRWLTLDTTEGPITAVVGQDGLFVQVLTPQFASAANMRTTGVNFPKAGLSFLHAIPGIGHKFGTAASTGPQGQPAEAQGEYRGSFSLYFGQPPK